MGVKKDKTRDVLVLFNHPTESATGWKEMFVALQEREKCVAHLKRNMLNRVRDGDKMRILMI